MSHYDHDVQLLLDRYPNLNHDLVTCDNERCTQNESLSPSVWNDHNEVPYLVNVRCTKCNQIWMICKICKLKKKMIKQEQVTAHKWKYHEKKRKHMILADNASDTSKKSKCDATDDSIGKNDKSTYYTDLYYIIKYDLTICINFCFFTGTNNQETMIACEDTSLSLIDNTEDKGLLGMTINDINRQVISVTSTSRLQSDCTDNNDDIRWHGDSNSESGVSPVRLFRKSSESMSRHSVKWLGKCPSPNVYRNSDNGRRKKVEKISFFGRYDNSDEETEYESAEEDWYYDPRNRSKWNWENDYCSLASNSTDTSCSLINGSKNRKYYIIKLSY